MLDIVGKTFGRLRVIEQTVAPEGTNPDKRGTWWLCKCDPELGGCGNEKVVFGRNLTSGSTKSCGCYHKEAASLRSKNRVESLIGQRFGRLLVVGRTDNETGRNYWICKCNPEFGGCGGETRSGTQSLLKGTSTSCGCYQRELAAQSAGKTSGKKFIDLTGKKFGKLTVIKRVEDYVAPSGGTSPRWLCVCDCEDHNEVIVNGGELRRTDDGATRSCGCNGLESYVAKELKKYCEETYSAIPEYKEFINPETGYVLPYDIFIPNHLLYIEVNGIQHYEDVWFGNAENFGYRQHKDAMKKEYAKQHGTYIEIDLRKIKTTEEAIKYVESFII